MGTVLLDMAISLDGYVSGPSGGDDGLHDWYFAPSGNASVVIDELLGTIGAMVLGRAMLGDPPQGFETPYKVPHFILTHTARPAIEHDGVQFVFVAEGLEQLLTQAQAAAGDKVVCVAGGATTAQQLMKAGLVDEVHLHVISKILGGGLRLFDGVGPLELERIRVIETPGVTHLRFRIAKG